MNEDLSKLGPEYIQLIDGQMVRRDAEEWARELEGAMMNECSHTITQGRKGERGSWCISCGVKVYDVDERQCQDCAHSRKLWGGTICNKHLMSVTPDMNVMFKIANGTCWTAKA